MLNNLKRWTEACEAYERGLRLEPRAAPLHAHLADSLMNRKLYAEAQRHYERALALEPRNREALAGAWYAALPLAAWGGAWRSREAELVRIAGGPEGPEALPLSAYQALFLPLSPEQRLRVAARRAAEQLRALPLSSAATTQEQRRQERVLVPGEPLRVGYVSRRFERYPGTQLMLRLFGAHDRRVVTVFAYATGPDDGSEERRVVARDADAFRDLSALLDPRDAARVIAADALHVLVDYDGAHDFNNLALLAQRPAPVQVTWLGFPGSSGFPRAVLDFILVDATVAAAASAAFSERLLVLPHSYQPQDERQGWARTPVPTRASEGLPDEGFVFVCFNRLDKVHPNVFAAWMEALRRAPHAVLWLLAEDTEARANVLAAAAEWGVGPERIVFAGRASRDRHLARHALADLFLDTLLYDAHTTASEALWMGVPVLTCPAAPFSSRVAASLLRSLELPELIAPSLRDYVELAVALATGRAWRSAASLRADLLRRRWEPRLSLFKSERFARGALEPALRLAWALRGSNSSVVFVGE
jgi:predicted O-linked N-acetylglucosamine transferase (SPINDLY family)